MHPFLLTLILAVLSALSCSSARAASPFNCGFQDMSRSEQLDFLRLTGGSRKDLSMLNGCTELTTELYIGSFRTNTERKIHNDLRISFAFSAIAGLLSSSLIATHLAEKNHYEVDEVIYPALVDATAISFASSLLLAQTPAIINGLRIHSLERGCKRYGKRHDLSWDCASRYETETWWPWNSSAPANKYPLVWPQFNIFIKHLTIVKSYEAFTLDWETPSPMVRATLNDLAKPLSSIATREDLEEVLNALRSAKNWLNDYVAEMEVLIQSYRFLLEAQPAHQFKEDLLSGLSDAESSIEERKLQVTAIQRHLQSINSEISRRKGVEEARLAKEQALLEQKKLEGRLLRKKEAARRAAARQRLLQTGQYRSIPRNSDNREENCRALCRCKVEATAFKYPTNKPKDVWVKGADCGYILTKIPYDQQRLCKGVDHYDLDWDGRPREVYGTWHKIAGKAVSNIGHVDCQN